MHTIYSLVAGLTGREEELLLHDLENNPEKQQSRLLEFFNLIRADKSAVLSMEQCADILYGENRVNSVQKLKARLREKLFNVMLSQRILLDNTESRKEFTTICKKATLWFLLKDEPGLRSVMNELLQDMVSKCIRHEYGGMATVLYNAARNHDPGTIQSSVRFPGNMMDNSFLIERATQRFRSMADSLKFRSGGIEEMIFCEEDTELLRLLKKGSAQGSSSLDFYASLFTFFREAMEPEKCLNADSGNRLLELVLSASALAKPGFLADLYYLMSHIYLHKGLLKQSLLFFRQASFRNYETPEASERMMLLSLHLAAYSGDLLKASSLAEDLLLTSGHDHIHYPLYTYVKAWCSFMQEEYQQAFTVLSQLKLPENYDPAWDILGRLIQVICCAETGMPDMAYIKYESLRKHLSRSKREPGHRMRVQLLFQLTGQYLSHKGFHDQQAGKKRDRTIMLFNSLNTTDPATRWVCGGAEVFPLDRWLAGHMTRRITGEKPAAHHTLFEKTHDFLNTGRNLSR